MTVNSSVCYSSSSINCSSDCTVVVTVAAANVLLAVANDVVMTV